MKFDDSVQNNKCLSIVTFSKAAYELTELKETNVIWKRQQHLDKA